jgi:bifunctional DNase/RNase
MIAVTIRGVATTEAGFVVLLQAEGEGEGKALPIAIGGAEAQAILFELNGREFPRPLTHDLFRSVLTELGATLAKIEVNELRDETFFATLHIDTHKGRIEVDSRPSDALALALRCEAPIYVAEDVMAKAGVALDKEGRHAAPVDEEQADPLRQLKAQLERAIAEERYEVAARLRDKLRELSGQ